MNCFLELNTSATGLCGDLLLDIGITAHGLAIQSLGKRSPDRNNTRHKKPKQLNLTKRILLASTPADWRTTRSSLHHVAQHRPTGSEATSPYAPRSSRFGSEPPSVEDDVDVSLTIIGQPCGDLLLDIGITAHAWLSNHLANVVQTNQK